MPQGLFRREANKLCNHTFGTLDGTWSAESSRGISKVIPMEHLPDDYMGHTQFVGSDSIYPSAPLPSRSQCFFFKVWGSSNNPSLRHWTWGSNLCEVIWSGRIRSSAGSRTKPHNTCCSCQGLYHGDAQRSRDLFMSLLWLCVVKERVFMVCPLLWHGRGGRRKFSSSRRRGYLPFLESLLAR